VAFLDPRVCIFHFANSKLFFIEVVRFIHLPKNISVPACLHHPLKISLRFKFRVEAERSKSTKKFYCIQFGSLIWFSLIRFEICLPKTPKSILCSIFPKSTGKINASDFHSTHITLSYYILAVQHWFQF
jgi:hypothetical protein